MESLLKLIGLGYRVWIENGNIRYKLLGGSSTQLYDIKEIFEEIKLKKDKIIKVLKLVELIQNSEATQALYTEHKILNDARVASGYMISEIIKELYAGENIYNLFLKAMKCIGKLTGNTTMPKLIEKDLVSIYGYGLGEPRLLQIELRNVEVRIDKLKLALESESDAGVKQRIESALKSHENTRNRLLKLCPPRP